VRLLGNPTEAEDVAQTVFMRAFQRFEELKPSPTAAGWLKTVTRNTCLNHLSRYRRRWRFFSELATTDDSSENFDRTELASVEPSITADLELAERQEQLERALRQLPDHQRVPLVLFHFEDLSYQEIAAALGVSLGKVKTDIHRGREALRQLMGAE
jgi:RNA polymerase sigma-70 factor (ECF subfamily)